MGKRSKKKPATPQLSSVPVGDIFTTEFTVSDQWVSLLKAFVIVMAGLWVFSPVFHGDWLWDDDWYLTNNPLLNDPARVWKAWFQPGSFVEYYPIEQSLQWMQWQWWHEDTLGYHLTNVGLHLVSALLVWRLFGKLGLPTAWLGGLLFVIHPANVESVAWISEFKNTLSLPFFLLSMCAWIDYEKDGRGRNYGLALGLFLVAMLCKITMAPFPAVILLYAWWKRGRIGWRDLLAAVPFLVISVVLGALAIWSSIWYWQALHKLPFEVSAGGLLPRLVLAGQTFTVYFAHAVWPVDLLPVYPLWRVDASSLFSFLPWVIFAAAVAWLWQKRKSWGRHVLFGLGFFFLMLTPFLGFDSVSYMEFTWVMDHFLYIPLIGLVGLAVAAMGTISGRLGPSRRIYGDGFVVLVLILLAMQSQGYAVAFNGEAMLWGYAVEHEPQNWLAQDNFGKALLLLNRPEEAKTHFNEVLRLRPDRSLSYYNVGRAWEQMDRFPEAIEMDEKALGLNPANAEITNNLGVVLAQTGRFDEALKQFRQATLLKPDYVFAYINVGNALAQTGHLSEAVEPLSTALKLNPNSPQAHDNLANVLLKLGRTSEAREHFRQALLLKPDDAKASEGLAKLEGQAASSPNH